jgi:hypothetical protein
MVVATYMFVLMLVVASRYVNGQNETLIGEHTNAIYFAKQYTDIQGHLYAALENGYENIRIADGTYFMARSLQINRHNVMLSGSVDTILQVNNSRVSGLAMFVVNGVSNVSISNIELDGYNNASKTLYELNGVALVNAVNAVVMRVSLKGFRNGVFTNVSRRVNFVELNVTSSQHDGFLVRNSTDIVLSNSSTCCNGRHGINFFGNLTNIVVSSNNVSIHNFDSACAVKVEGGMDVVLNNNALAINEIGICLKNLVNVQVLRNVMNNVSDFKCIQINNITNSQFISNECNAKVINPLTPPPMAVVTMSPPPPPPKREQKSASSISVMSCMLVVVSVMSAIVITS